MAEIHNTIKTFANPIVQPYGGGGGSADPSVIRINDYYYWVKSIHDTGIGVAKSGTLQDMGNAPMKIVFTPPASGEYSKEIWAPEIQYLNGNFYIYFAADDGNNVNHRMYCLQADSQDPQGHYTFKGKVAAPDDKWAIDGLVLQKPDGSLFFVWSGCEVDADFPQNLYIAPMSNPGTISGPKVLISTPAYAWERKGAAINEGPSILQKNGKFFIFYSGSASWMNDYCLGMLTNADGDVLNPSSWSKKETPVFQKAPSAYGPGHNCFTQSPDGTEDWILYHAFERWGGGWANRSIRAQKINWDGDNPILGTPVAVGERIDLPSGSAPVPYSVFLPHNMPGYYIRHEDSRGKISSKEEPSLSRQFKVVAGLADTAGISLESIDFPNRFLRQRNIEIWMDVFDGSDTYRADATFYVHSGWADGKKISFESYSNPGKYMRHLDSLLYISPISTQQDKEDATFQRIQ
ncbi:MAG: family 43 glycosylhydrolase [Spirochaetales bacterium]|nr:family 43 glycosylhydrolase [Spirochaetales bacterium]